MENAIIAVLGMVSLVLLVSIILYSIHRKAVYVANLIFSLTLLLVLTCVTHYATPLPGDEQGGQAVVDFLNGLLPWCLGWIIVSAVLVILMNILVPFIHQNFAIERTPVGEKDKIVSIKDIRRSA
jgi:hypothetical protein